MLAHLEALHGSTAGTDQSICIAWTAAQQPWTHVWPTWETIQEDMVPPTERHFWRNWLRNGRHHWNMYTGVCSYKPAKAALWRKQENVQEVPGVWADLDVKPGVEGHFQSQDELEAFIAKLPPMTMRIASGSGGVHGYWLFDQRCSAGDRTRDLLDGWHEYMRVVADGRQVDYVQEIARVLRVAGTVRWTKVGDSDETSQHTWNRVELQHVASERYSALDFEAFVQPHLTAKREREQAARTRWTANREAALASLERRGLKMSTQVMLEQLFNTTQDWEPLLTAAGWTLNTDRRGRDGNNACRYWTRPGKDPKDGGSASTDFRGSNVITFFSAEIPQLDELVVPGLTTGNNHGASTKYRFALITMYGNDEGRLVRDIARGKGRVA